MILPSLNMQRVGISADSGVPRTQQYKPDNKRFCQN
jgi:hypothetical protein